MGVRKNAFVRDLVRVIIATLQDAQREWSQVIPEVGADPVGAVNLIWGNRQRFPNIGHDRVSVNMINELFRLAHSTAPSIDQLPVYFLKYLNAKKGVTGFVVTPTDERNLLRIFEANKKGTNVPNVVEEESNENITLLLIAKNFRLRDLITAVYEYLNKTQIKRDYDRVYATQSHQRVRLASERNPTCVYDVVLKYLDSLDRGF